ncbi:unnamed protein product [Owenia fusiformis]|uniref:Uncharacterized protein n=1 Tax=Owenia fusiformis TaxID=6347 RepID=A0A8J1TAL8_OWEFU|nr:unnamed protein product [Owenia fusiformis]
MYSRYKKQFQDARDGLCKPEKIKGFKINEKPSSIRENTRITDISAMSGSTNVNNVLDKVPATWKSKAKTFFFRFDTDGDGLHTRRDYEEIVNRLTGYLKKSGSNPSDDRLQGLKHTFIDVVWSEFVAGNHDTGSNRKVTLQEFTTNVAKKLDEREYAEAVCKAISTHYFDIIDINSDGSISLKEYGDFMELFGVDPKHAPGAFESLDADCNNEISREEFFNAMQNFWLSMDDTGFGACMLGPLIKW